jgi:hypothetical protein
MDFIEGIPVMRKHKRYDQESLHSSFQTDTLAGKVGKATIYTNDRQMRGMCRHPQVQVDELLKQDLLISPPSPKF